MKVPVYTNAALSNSVVAASTAPGYLSSYSFDNLGTADAFVQFFDLPVSQVVLGTTPPSFTCWIPKGNNWADRFTGEDKIVINNALSMAATSTASGSGAPITALNANVFFASKP